MRNRHKQKDVSVTMKTFLKYRFRLGGRQEATRKAWIIQVVPKKLVYLILILLISDTKFEEIYAASLSHLWT